MKYFVLDHVMLVEYGGGDVNPRFKYEPAVQNIFLPFLNKPAGFRYRRFFFSAKEINDFTEYFASGEFVYYKPFLKLTFVNGRIHIRYFETLAEAKRVALNTLAYTKKDYAELQ